MINQGTLFGVHEEVRQHANHEKPAMPPNRRRSEAISIDTLALYSLESHRQDTNRELPQQPNMDYHELTREQVKPLEKQGLAGTMGLSLGQLVSGDDSITANDPWLSPAAIEIVEPSTKRESSPPPPPFSATRRTTTAAPTKPSPEISNSLKVPVKDRLQRRFAQPNNVRSSAALSPERRSAIEEQAQLNGLALKAVREEAGISLKKISEITKIGVHHLSGLEAGAPEANLPAIFVKGFVSEYARVLGLNPAKIASAYMRGLDS